MLDTCVRSGVFVVSLSMGVGLSSSLRESMLIFSCLRVKLVSLIFKVRVLVSTTLFPMGSRAVLIMILFLTITFDFLLYRFLCLLLMFC